MKIKVEYRDASEPDCRRVDYCVTVDGTEHCLAPCALETKYSEAEALERARSLFGSDTELEF